MNTAVQYIKDFQGNDVWAVLPIEEYRFLRDTNVLKNTKTTQNY